MLLIPTRGFYRLHEEHGKSRFCLGITEESRMTRNQSVHWLKEGDKMHGLGTTLEVLCYNETLDSA